jgi:glucose/arabinose dehydrogenase
MTSRSALFSRRPLLAVAGSVALAASTLAAAPSASAGDGSGSSGGPTVVASGLNSPRQLSFGPHGALYVAEAGTGGSGPCVVGPTGKVCFGRTGSVTRVAHGSQHRVLTRLPSVAGAGGAEPIGPADVLVGRHGRYVLSIGAGQDTTNRRALGRHARRLGTWVTGRLGHHSRVLADLAAFEAATNPDKSVAHDSDPTGITISRRGLVGTDSGGNTLVRLRAHRHAGQKRVRALAVFPEVTVAQPGGGTGPMQAVPTSVAVGPDGALYVSQLTGFPFPAGAAHIFRFVAGHQPTVYASGLTNVTDLAWSHGKLYAVQISDTGLLTGATGSLLRVHRGDNTMEDTVAGGLTAPYGVAIRHHAAYVTTCAVGGPDCAGKGTVLRIPLS